MTLHLTPRAASPATIVRELWSHRDVLVAMSRADFRVRYKRASFGMLWAVVVPLLQAAVLAVVFSRFIRLGEGREFGAYVLGGVLAWGYFALTIGVGSTAIVDGSGLTDKVWFPRALLPLVPCLANLVGLGISMAAVAVLTPILGGKADAHLLLLVPASMLLIAFTAAFALVASALHVYFRDVRFMVQAALLVWFYATPIVYPLELVEGLRPWLRLNPMTGVVGLYHAATVGGEPGLGVAVLVTVVTTVTLLAVAVVVYGRHDRLFVDQL